MRKLLFILTLVISVSGAMAYDFLNENMDTDPGWSTTGSWAWGTPTGGCSSHPDPTSGYTGPNVYGYNLNGCYENNMSEEYLTTPVFDCTGYSTVYLAFYRWLGCESSSYDHAKIQVTNDNGANWTDVWVHSGGSVQDSSWQYVTFDLSTELAGHAQCAIRWVQGTSDGSVAYSGWNIDDVVVTDFLEPTATPTITPTPTTEPTEPPTETPTATPTLPPGFYIVGDTSCSTTVTSIPVDHWYGYTESQYYIPDTEMAAAGFTSAMVLNTIGWYLCSDDVTAATHQVSVWLDLVAPPGPDLCNGGGLPSGTLVYSGPLGDCSPTGCCMVTLSTPFVYQPGNCLLVTVCDTQSGYSGGSSRAWAANPSTDNGIYARHDSGAYDCDMTTDSHYCADAWTTTCFQAEPLATPTPTPTTPPELVLITEVLYDAPSGQPEPGAEWIEISNCGSSAVDISGWEITDDEMNYPPSGEGWMAFPSGTVLNPGDIIVVANDGSVFNSIWGPAGMPPFTFEMNDSDGDTTNDMVSLGGALGLGNSGDEVVLYRGGGAGGAVDAVSWGSAGPYPPDTTASAPDCYAGLSLQRCPLCYDTNDCSMDFQCIDVPDPGMPNSCTNATATPTETPTSTMTPTPTETPCYQPIFYEDFESGPGLGQFQNCTEGTDDWLLDNTYDGLGCLNGYYAKHDYCSSGALERMYTTIHVDYDCAVVSYCWIAANWYGTLDTINVYVKCADGDPCNGGTLVVTHQGGGNDDCTTAYGGTYQFSVGDYLPLCQSGCQDFYLIFEYYCNDACIAMIDDVMVVSDVTGACGCNACPTYTPTPTPTNTPTMTPTQVPTSTPTTGPTYTPTQTPTPKPLPTTGPVGLGFLFLILSGLLGISTFKRRK